MLRTIEMQAVIHLREQEPQLDSEVNTQASILVIDDNNFNLLAAKHLLR